MSTSFFFDAKEAATIFVAAVSLGFGSNVAQYILAVIGPGNAILTLHCNKRSLVSRLTSCFIFCVRVLETMHVMHGYFDFYDILLLCAMKLIVERRSWVGIIISIRQLLLRPFGREAAHFSVCFSFWKSECEGLVCQTWRIKMTR